LPTVAFESIARPLVMMHALSAIVLIGASTHHALIALGYLRGRYAARLGRIYAATMLVAYGLTYALGALAYPTFRYHTRALYLDRAAPAISNLFDIKEHFASLGLPLVLGAFVLSRVMVPGRDSRPLLAGYAVMVWGTTFIVWFGVLAGLWITLTRSVP
jgi:hypothetical protein